MGAYLDVPNTDKYSERGLHNVQNVFPSTPVAPAGNGAPNSAKNNNEKLAELEFSVSTMQGWRKTMEDAHICSPNLERQREVSGKTSLFAVFDGHGGKEVSIFCARHYVDVLLDLESFKARAYKESLIESFHAMDDLIRHPRSKDELQRIKALPASWFFSRSKKHIDFALPSPNEMEHVAEEDDDERSRPLSTATEPSVSGMEERLDRLERGNLLTEDALAEASRTPAPVSMRLPTDASKDIVNRVDDNADLETFKNDHIELASGISNGSPNQALLNKAKQASKSLPLRSESINQQLLIDGTDSSLGIDEEPDEKARERKPPPVPARPVLSTKDGAVQKFDTDDEDDDDLDIDSMDFPSDKDLKPPPLPKPPQQSEKFPSSLTSKIETGLKNGEKKNGLSHTEAIELILQVISLGNRKAKLANAAPEPQGKVVPHLNFDSPDLNLPTTAGTTACVALIVDNKLFVANAGDSRAVLCRNNGAKPMSFDHKPDGPIEKARIERAGGWVTLANRVCGNLNLSRCIGDLKFKMNPNIDKADQIITAQPDVESTDLTQDDLFLIIACDGVWDIMTNPMIVRFVQENLANQVAIKLREQRDAEANTKKNSSPTEKKSESNGVSSNANTGAGQTFKVDLRHVIEELFSVCLCDDPIRSEGKGGDNMTCMIICLKPLEALAAYFHKEGLGNDI